MVRRSRLEIYFEILKVLDREVDKPTQIMYKTNTSWITLKELFETLLDGGFIIEEEKRDSKRYYITDKGRNALNYYLKSIDGIVKTRQSIIR